MCNIHGERKGTADGADGADGGDDDDDADSWIAESIARAQHCFSTAEKLDPKNVDNLCNFAVFSSEIAGDVSRAKGRMPSCTSRAQILKLMTELFARALKCNENHAETLLNYANFLDAQDEHEQGV